MSMKNCRLQYSEVMDLVNVAGKRGSLFIYDLQTFIFTNLNVFFCF